MPNLQSPKANQTWTLICTTQLTELTRQQHDRGDDNPKAPNCCTHKFWVAAPGGIKQSKLHHSHKASPQGKHNLTLLQNQLVSFNNNKQKMPYVPKIYKLHINLLEHLKLTRVNVLILANLETDNKELKFGKDKDHIKNYQDGLTRESHPSKLGMQPTHSKKYATLQSFVNSHYIASEPKSKQKCSRSIRSKLTCNYYSICRE